MLTCTVAESYPQDATDQLINQKRHRIEAKLFNQSVDGVWQLRGNMLIAHNDGDSEPISGRFYEYENGQFDLLGSTSSLRITIMPENRILEGRGVQGVLMRDGETVANGLPVSAACSTQNAEER